MVFVSLQNSENVQSLIHGILLNSKLYLILHLYLNSDFSLIKLNLTTNLIQRFDPNDSAVSKSNISLKYYQICIYNSFDIRNFADKHR